MSAAPRRAQVTTELGNQGQGIFHCYERKLQEKENEKLTDGWILTICLSIFKSIENGDTHQFEALVSELVNYLDWISEAAETDLDNGDTESDAFEILNEIYHFTSSPSLDQEMVRASTIITNYTFLNLKTQSLTALLLELVLQEYIGAVKPYLQQLINL
uniref:Uncharacterized protein n=1 Tax=Cucumis melo TaxID=3656 RepID=A0A9I9EBM8_CUCME